MARSTRLGGSARHGRQPAGRPAGHGRGRGSRLPGGLWRRVERVARCQRGRWEGGRRPLNWANWPGYMDWDESGSTAPTLTDYTAKTGFDGEIQRGDRQQRGLHGRHQPAARGGRRHRLGHDHHHRLHGGPPHRPRLAGGDRPGQGPDRGPEPQGGLQGAGVGSGADVPLPISDLRRRRRLQPRQHGHGPDLGGRDVPAPVLRQGHHDQRLPGHLLDDRPDAPRPG